MDIDDAICIKEELFGAKARRICGEGELSYTRNYSTTKRKEFKGPYDEAQSDEEDLAYGKNGIPVVECCLHLLACGLLRDNNYPLMCAKAQK